MNNRINRIRITKYCLTRLHYRYDLRKKQSRASLCPFLYPVYKTQFDGAGNTGIPSILLGKDETLCPNCQKAHLKIINAEDSS